MQQVSAIVYPIPFWAGLFLIAAALTLPGCEKQQATTYSAPKDSTPAAAVSSPAPAIPTTAPPTAPIRWTTPSGWQEQPASGMRVGSFVITKNGQRADVSIIPLGGVSGSELDNVNRWRGQIGLAAIDAAKLADSGEKVSIGNVAAALYDIAGTDPKTQQPTRILGSILPSEGTAWFFKMTGPEALVAQEKPAFNEFLKSVRFESGDAPHTTAAHSALTSANMKEMAGIVEPTASSAEKPAWDLPAGWKEQQPPSSMRVASFQVTGDNGAKADVSVIKLSGLAGGILANVNRWRSQVGLPPVDEAGLEKLITTREVNGSKVIVADMVGHSMESGDQTRLLAAIVPRGGNTWFYKMVGNDALVSQQKSAFIKFVETARYPNAS